MNLPLPALFLSMPLAFHNESPVTKCGGEIKESFGTNYTDCKKADLEFRQFAPCTKDKCEKTKAVEAPFTPRGSLVGASLKKNTMDRTSYTTSWANTRGTLSWTHRIFHEDTFKEQYIGEVKALSKWPSEAPKTRLQVQPNMSRYRIYPRPAQLKCHL
jgi:hypothetical protein